MKHFTIYVPVLALLIAASAALTSCGDGGPDVCQPEDYVDTWVGKYVLAGLLTLPNNDTLTVTFNGNTATLSSKLLGGESFSATYDPETGDIDVANINISMIVFGTDTFSNISVADGRVRLNSQCNRLFLNLNELFVGDGTVNIPGNPDGEDDYPLGPVDLSTFGQGFSRL